MTTAAAATFVRRFPLVPRPRPPCRPLAHRVATLRERADLAERDGDMAEASAVLNLAALLASDCGLPDVARQWCHRHAALYLGAAPLEAQPALLALEPLVNLARLRIRTDEGLHAAALVEALYRAVATRSDTVLEGVEVPASRLTVGADAHSDVRKWLWAVFLATSARALASAGRWQEAHERLHRHKGIGRRLLDGRQVAVIARAVDDPAGALALIDSSVRVEPWEGVVAAVLAAHCRHRAGQPADGAVIEAAERWSDLPPTPGLGVFHTRLGLSVLDATAAIGCVPMEDMATAVVRRALEAPDGYTARDVLADAPCVGAMSPEHADGLYAVVRSCGIGSGTIGAEAMSVLSAALSTSEAVIQRNLARASQAWWRRSDLGPDEGARSGAG